MKWLRLAILPIILISLLNISTHAQENELSDLEAMLSLVPATPLTRNGMISYVDYNALTAARPGAMRPGSLAQWNLMRDLPAVQLYESGAMMGVNSGVPEVSYFFRDPAAVQDIIGFNFLQVDQSMYIGTPPEDLRLFRGRFDVDKITTAYSEIGFTTESINNLAVLCSEDGCEAGMEFDPELRVPENPFKGDLGLRQPILVTEDVLAGSGALPITTQVTETYTGDFPSLLTIAAYQGAVEALLAQGSVAQAEFIDVSMPDMLGTFALDPFMITQADDPQAILEELVGDFNTFAPPALVVLADVSTDDAQIGIIGLVYGNEDDAIAAGEELISRLETAQSIATQRPFADLFAEREITVEDPIVHFSEAANRYVMLLPLHAPIPSDEPDEDTGLLTASSMAYRLLVRAYYNRDLYWLAHDLTVPQ